MLRVSIACALGVTEEQKEKETKEEAEGGRADSGQRLVHLQSLGEALKQSNMFQNEDDDVQGMYLTTYAPREGLVVEASNAVFKDLFCGAQELMACQIHLQTASPLLFAA